MRHEVDPTADIKEFTAIRRIDQMEIELIDSWLREIGESPEREADRQYLLELRGFCQLRHRLLCNLEQESFLTTSVA